jgi:hypothetical protein
LFGGILESGASSAYEIEGAFQGPAHDGDRLLLKWLAKSAMEIEQSAQSKKNSRTDGTVEFGQRIAHTALPKLLLTSPFLLLFLAQLARHEMWRDELNAFGIARASPNLSSLLRHVHYEGHPWLWYWMLWVVTRLTSSPIGMKVLQAAIGTAVYVLIGLASPFSRVEKVLIFLSYFISFEYTVLSRMYGVVLLLLLVYLQQRARYPQRFLSNSVLLGLMASADMMGILLSGALFIELSFSALKAPTKMSTERTRQLAYGSATYAALTALSLLSLLPPSDMSWRPTAHLFRSVGTLLHLLNVTVRYLALPYFPMIQPGSFWNAFPGDPNRHLAFLAAFLPFVVAAYYFLFRRHPNLLLLMGVTIVSSITFAQLVYTGYLRHYGITFLAFLAAVWLLRAQIPRLPAAAYALIGLTAVGGVYAEFQAWQRPFSNAEHTAKWLRANHLDAGPLVAGTDIVVASIAVLLNRPIYMLDCSCSDRFLLFSNRRDWFTESQIPDRLVAVPNALHVTQLVYVSNRAFTSTQESSIRSNGFSVKPLASFTGAQQEDENFYVYQICAEDVLDAGQSEATIHIDDHPRIDLTTNLCSASAL